MLMMLLSLSILTLFESEVVESPSAKVMVMVFEEKYWFWAIALSAAESMLMSLSLMSEAPLSSTVGIDTELPALEVTSIPQEGSMKRDVSNGMIFRRLFIKLSPF